MRTGDAGEDRMVVATGDAGAGTDVAEERLE
jgi:hypothetical protein